MLERPVTAAGILSQAAQREDSAIKRQRRRVKSVRPAFRRDASFSAWLRDDDEEQIRMNEEGPTNLRAALPEPALRQGRLTPISLLPAAITAHSARQKPALSRPFLQSTSCTNLNLEGAELGST